MRNYFATGCCGLSPRQGTILSGIYMMLAGFVYAVFNGGNLRNVVILLRSVNNTEEVSNALRVIPYLYYAFYGLIGITYCMIFLLFISVDHNRYEGILLYMCWIAIYEVLNFIFLITIHVLLETAGFSLPRLQWIGFSIRICLHFYWMVYVMTYTMDLKHKRSVRMKRQTMVRRKHRPLTSNYAPSHLTQMRRNLYFKEKVQENPKRSDMAKGTSADVKKAVDNLTDAKNL